MGFGIDDREGKARRKTCFVTGHDFSRAACCPKLLGPLAPAGRLHSRCVILFAAGLVFFASAARFHAQSSPQSAPSPQTKPQSGMGGISSAGTFEPTYDAQKRPITAGGFVDKGPIVFQDVTKASGLASWQHVMGTRQKKYILETDGSGVGLIDYDNDGWLDIFLVNGSTYDALSDKAKAPHAALFHNNHDGTFTDMATKAG